MTLIIRIKGVPILVDVVYGKDKFSIEKFTIDDTLFDYLLEEMSKEELNNKIISETLKTLGK